MKRDGRSQVGKGGYTAWNLDAEIDANDVNHVRTDSCQKKIGKVLKVIQRGEMFMNSKDSLLSPADWLSQSFRIYMLLHIHL